MTGASPQLPAADWYRSPVSWIIVAIGIFGAAVVAWSYHGSAVTFASAAVLAAVLLVLLGLLGWWILSRIRPIRSAPPARGLACLAWGATGATGCGILANTGENAVLARTIGPEAAAVWGAALSAPLNEELLKIAGLALLVLAVVGFVRGPMEGFIYGALVGLGFQLAENWTYALNQIVQAGGVDPVLSAIQSLQIRVLLTGLGSHWAMSAVAGAGIGYLVTRRGSGRRVLAGVGLIVLAILMHGLFDAPVLANPVWAKALVNFGIAMVVYFSLRRRLRTAARAELDGHSRALLARRGRRRELHKLPRDDRQPAAEQQRVRLARLEEHAYAAT